MRRVDRLISFVMWGIIAMSVPVMAMLAHDSSYRSDWPYTMALCSPTTMGGAVGILELIGGALLVIGLFTRPTAFILSGMCAVAYFYAHAPKGRDVQMLAGHAA